MLTLFDTINEQMVKRGHDKKFPGAAAVMQRAATTYADIRAEREAIRANKLLSTAGQHSQIMASLEKAAAELAKHRRQIDTARASIDAKRQAMRPKFDKVDPVILVAVAAQVAGMPASDQAAAILTDADPIAAQAVLTLPAILTNVNNELRERCEAAIMAKNHGPALAAIEDEREAWNGADAALNTAMGAVQEAGEFTSGHAFDLWLKKITPPDRQQLAAEAKENESFVAQSILVASETLSHDTRMRLHTDLVDQSVVQLKKELAA